MYPVPLFRIACIFTELKEDEADRIKDMLDYLEIHDYEIDQCSYDGEWTLSIRDEDIEVYNDKLTGAIEELFEKVKAHYEKQNPTN